MQECSPLSPQDVGMILLYGGWDTHSSALGLQTQQKQETNGRIMKIFLYKASVIGFEHIFKHCIK
jgi:hypothetical protein